MSHVHEETLADAALGESGPLSLRDRAHLLRCRQCAGQLDDLQKIVATGRSGPVEPLRPPRPGLLAAVQAELDQDEEGDEDPRTNDLRTAPATLPGRTAPQRHPARWVAAAAAVAVVAAGGTVVYRETSQHVLATAVLSPLPAKSGSGTAEMIRSRREQELSITITTAPPANAFEEVWLFDADGRGMISVGIVPPTGHGTFPLPAASTALRAYTVVDISLEPYDGNPAHSHNSILRGTLS